jgi:hypothetical protein
MEIKIHLIISRHILLLTEDKLGREISEVNVNLPKHMLLNVILDNN